MNVKYTEEQINEICRLYEAGEKISKIAELVDCEESSISRIANSRGLRRKKKSAAKSGGGKTLPQMSQSDWY